MESVNSGRSLMMREDDLLSKKRQNSKSYQDFFTTSSRAIATFNMNIEEERKDSSFNMFMHLDPKEKYVL